MLQFFNKKQGERGFTLIELLVVIAIIGILATIVLVSLNSARSKARNARRVSDLRQIQLAQEIYWDSNPSVGYAATLATLVTGGAIASEPKDPTTNGSYNYCFVALGGVNSDYVVGTSLEPTQVAGQGLMATSLVGASPCVPAGGTPAMPAACGSVSLAGLGAYCVSN